MHGSPPPPEYIRTLRELLALAKGNPSIEDAVVAFAAALHKHALGVGCETGYAEGLRQRAKGLPEIAKPRGRPKSVDRVLRELGMSWEDFSNK